MLFRRDTWREAGMSLRRAHKDSRARKHLLAVFALVAAPVACALYLLWLAGSGALFVVPFVLPVIWWRSRREKQDAEPIRITPDNKPVITEPTEREKADLRRYFAEVALVYAVIVDRAGSERFLKEKELPEGVAVVSRRKHLDLLGEYGLLERMAPEDRIAMMAADGHWNWNDIHGALLAMEAVRLLRWMLGVDHFLPVTGVQLKGDYGIARGLLEEPAKLLAGTKFAESSDMLTGRDAAHHYFVRCWAEAIHRRLVSVDDTEAATWATGVVTSLQGKQNEDFVLGTELVSEAGDEVIARAIELSRQRVRFLNWAMQVWESRIVPAQIARVFPEMRTVETEDEIAATP